MVWVNKFENHCTNTKNLSNLGNNADEIKTLNLFFFRSHQNSSLIKTQGGQRHHVLVSSAILLLTTILGCIITHFWLLIYPDGERSQSGRQKPVGLYCILYACSDSSQQPFVTPQSQRNYWDPHWKDWLASI